MESFPNNLFKMNISNNSSPENDKKFNLNFSNSNNNYENYQEDDKYYLNRLFSFSDEEKEEEKLFPFPFPFYDLDEDKKIENSFDSNKNNDKEVKMDISNEKIIITNNSNSISNTHPNNKSSMTKDKGEEVMEKISNYITNYQEIILNQTAVKSQNHFDLDSNVKLAENTLPGSIISLMKKEGHPLSINYISERIKDRFLSFRKANGAKYKKDINIVLKSTLNTSGIFYRVGNDTYYFKEVKVFQGKKVLKKRKKRKKIKIRILIMNFRLIINWDIKYVN